MKKVTSAGGIVIDKNKVLLILLESGLYAIPKGHIELNESVEQAAIREVEEETAVKAEIIVYLGKIERKSEEDTGEIVDKTIEVYKMYKNSTSEVTPDENSEWVDINLALGKMHFEEESTFIQTQLSKLIEN